MSASNSESVEECIQEYTRLSLIPAPETARLIRDPSDKLVLDSKWSQIDVIRQEKAVLTKSVLLDSTTMHALFSSPFVAEEPRLWDVMSPSGTLRAVCISKKATSGDALKFFLQIWHHHEMVKCIDLTALKKHGDVYKNDGVFGGMSWSHDEGHIVYTANRLRSPEATSYFATVPSKSDSVNNSNRDGDDPSSRRGHQYDLEENWGEQMEYSTQPVLCVLDLDTSSVSILDNVPDGVDPGQAIWCPEDAGILFVGWQTTPYKLGLIYCTQRISAIYHIDFLTARCRTVGHDKRSVSSPRFSPNGALVVWLERDAGGPHMQCSRLISCEWASKEIRVVIDLVEKAGDRFPGINASSLPQRCWCPDNRRLVMSSCWRSRMEVLVIDTTEKVGRMLSTGLTVGTGLLLDILDDVMVAKLSSPSRPHYLAIAKLPDVGQEDAISWHPVDIGNGTCNPTTITDITWTILTHTPRLEHPEYGAQDFESILIGPSDTAERKIDATGLPLLVFPHGGPHSVFSAEFSRYVAGLVLLGYAVLEVNYRGSFGFGQEFIKALPGHVGEFDVADCFQATEEALTSDMFHIDASRVAVWGGSHGGFLAAHLSARYPLYRAAVLRNPVINIASMVGATDIPDWCWVEAGFPFDQTRPPLVSPDALVAMLNCSPIIHVDSARAPTLIVIGLQDKRVPTKQGMEWYKALKARHIPTRLLQYPDDPHAITSVPADSDCFVNIVQWFNQWLPSTSS